LEDICVQYDGTVRNSFNEVVQFVYGGDGLDPACMEGKEKPVDFERTYHHVRSSFRDEGEPPVAPCLLEEMVDSLLARGDYEQLDEAFKKELRWAFFSSALDLFYSECGQ
jgi:DNA-directed RNA polymerase III subunit RPC1